MVLIKHNTIGEQLMFKKSIRHLEENNMGYWEHLTFAFSHGVRCIKAGFLLILHSIIPSLFPKTGSKLVNKLNKDFTEHNEWLELKLRMEKFRNVYRSSK